EPLPFEVGCEAIEPDDVLADIGVDRQRRRFAGSRQRPQDARGAMHLVSDTADVEDDVVLAIGVDDTFELADHSATCSARRAAAEPRWWACVIAMASASAASSLS